MIGMSKQNFKIFLAPKKEDVSFKPHATVEAEYGNDVIKGEIITLAHHVGEYKSNPAPCVVDVEPLEGGNILISHIDLDTIGGLLAVMGQKPDHPGFWEAVAFIDLNGRHHLNKLPEAIHPYIKGAWAIDAKYRRRFDELTDVTDLVFKYANDLQRLLDGDKELIRQGEEEFAALQAKQEACLVEEDEFVRLFRTETVPCSSAYYSPTLRKVVPFIVVYNDKWKSVTVSCEGGQLNVGEFVKTLWGEGAGGHAGIGGSPRGQEMSFEDAKEAVMKIKEKMNQ
jgi:hypothetical protein